MLDVVSFNSFKNYKYRNNKIKLINNNIREAASSLCDSILSLEMVGCGDYISDCACTVVDVANNISNCIDSGHINSMKELFRLVTLLAERIIYIDSVVMSVNTRSASISIINAKRIVLNVK